MSEDFVIIKSLEHLTEEMTKAGIPFRNFPGKPLSSEQRHARLFHYTSRETFVNYIWKNKELKAGEIPKLNDLYERYKIISSELPKQMAIIGAFDAVRSRYRQISFTMDYDSFIEGCMSPLMWAYYAQGTEGVCIEFDPTKIHFSIDDIRGDVEYQDWPSRRIVIPRHVRSITALDKFLRDNSQQIFFTKDSCWRQENEYRIVTQRVMTKFDDDAIKCVYVASYDSETCLAIENTVGDSVPVKFLHLDEDSHPIVSDTRKYRSDVINAQQNPLNFLNNIQRKVIRVLEDYKDNPDADLSIDYVEG